MADYDNSGALFVNDKKENDKQPDFTGNITVNGVKSRIAGWKKTSESGKNFIAIRVSESEQQPKPAPKKEDDFVW